MSSRIVALLMLAGGAFIALLLLGIGRYGISLWRATRRERRERRERYWLPIQEQLERDCGVKTLAELKGEVPKERIVHW